MLYLYIQQRNHLVCGVRDTFQQHGQATRAALLSWLEYQLYCACMYGTYKDIYGRI